MSQGHSLTCYDLQSDYELEGLFFFNWDLRQLSEKKVWMAIFCVKKFSDTGGEEKCL